MMGGVPLGRRVSASVLICKQSRVVSLLSCPSAFHHVRTQQVDQYQTPADCLQNWETQSTSVCKCPSLQYYGAYTD